MAERIPNKNWKICRIGLQQQCLVTASKILKRVWCRSSGGQWFPAHIARLERKRA